MKSAIRADGTRAVSRNDRERGGDRIKRNSGRSELAGFREYEGCCRGMTDQDLTEILCARGEFEFTGFFAASGERDEEIFGVSGAVIVGDSDVPGRGPALSRDEMGDEVAAARDDSSAATRSRKFEWARDDRIEDRGRFRPEVIEIDRERFPVADHDGSEIDGSLASRGEQSVFDSSPGDRISTAHGTRAIVVLHRQDLFGGLRGNRFEAQLNRAARARSEGFRKRSARATSPDHLKRGVQR